MRKHQRKPQQQEKEKPHEKLKKNCKEALKNAKQENWKRLITQTKPWGIPYELFVKQKGKTAVQLPLTSKKGDTTTHIQEASQMILEENFPRLKPRVKRQIIDRDNTPQETEQQTEAMTK